MSARGRGAVIEVEVDHRKVPYANFVKMLGEMGGRVVSRDGFWPLSKYKILLPKKSVREFLSLLEDAQRSEAEAQQGG
jgi:hypothetical protein